MNEKVQHVFLVGAKGLGTYGGYETFINKLTEYHQNERQIKYHVACKANGDGYTDEIKLKNVKRLSDTEFEYHNAHCFKIRVPEKIGAAQAIYYDLAALKRSCQIIKEKNIKTPIIYILACRIGPFIHKFYNEIHRMGGKIFLNPDGHEWMRKKWCIPVRKYWRLSERLMVKYSDLVVCDSINIERYIHDSYDQKGVQKKNPCTVFISYGAETRKSLVSEENEKYKEWMKSKELLPYKYYLVVGRFVPENNYETMIREFMKCDSKKDLVIISNVNERFLNKLEERLQFKKDIRIKFVGTVYDQELLIKIRENAFGYLHGHEVGGTNPSLLEAMGSTDLNMLLDVCFNREVAGDAALYWSKAKDSLSQLINSVDHMSDSERKRWGTKAQKRIQDAYSWEYISTKYAEAFLNNF